MFFLGELFRKLKAKPAQEEQDEPLTAESYDLISPADYVIEPCGLLPLPYALCHGDPAGYEHIAGAHRGAPMSVPEGAFCRLCRRLGDMERASSKTLSVRQLFLREEEDDRVLLAAFGRSAKQAIASPCFCDKLCIAVHDRVTGDCVGVGLAFFDEETGEVFIDSVLTVVPNDEASEFIIKELLRRASGLAGFVTASAPYKSGLERLLRKCGFYGGDIWCANAGANE